MVATVTKVTRAAAVFICFWGLLGQSAAALAGMQVEQKVVYAGAKPTTSAFSWMIGEREFRLDVTSAGTVRSFVFNGRVFYVCGKLSKDQLDYVRTLNLSDQTLLTSLGRGACQELSTDFALNFFLSPFEAVGSTEVTGGLATSLQVSTPNTELTGKAANVSGAKCVEFSRSYKLTDPRTQASQIVSETACNAPTVKWRQAMSRELGMTLLRQPGGRQSFQAITSDVKKMAGLSLSARGKSSGRSVSGKDFTRSYEVSTSGVTEAALSPAQLALPAGFEVLDLGNLKALASHRTAPAKPGSEAVSGGLDIPEVVRALIMGASPLIFAP